MNPASVDIKDIIIAETSLGYVFGTNIFIGEEPISPDNCVTIFDTPGFPQMLTATRGENYYYPSVQIRVRNGRYDTGWDKANDIVQLLHARAQGTVNGTLYSLIRAMGEPVLLDIDENERYRFVMNFDIQRR